MEPRASKHEVLNTGTSIHSICSSLLLDHLSPSFFFYFLAIVRMRGVVPEALSGGSNEKVMLVYKRLHELTGSQGKVKHVQCLERGE